MKRKTTAGEQANKALADTTKYNALEVGHGMSDDLDKHFRECIEKHRDIIDEDEFCLVMVVGTDPLIKNLIRRKFYAWPFLPKPRPNQTVLLYNKRLDRITKRLWVLPCDMVMAELASIGYVDKRYQTMQAWSIAFFRGTFWEYIRHEHGIKMLSEQEYISAHREELIKSGCKEGGALTPDTFDFTKVLTYDLENSSDTAFGQDGFDVSGKVQDSDRNISAHKSHQLAV